MSRLMDAMYPDTMSITGMIWIHVIAAIPPTLAALAALITALHAKRNTQKIIVAVNGERAELHEEIAKLRKQLRQS